MKKLVNSNAFQLEKMLDYYTLKNKTLSRNIANIATDGYKRQDVEFKEVFDKNMSEMRSTDMIKTTDYRHMDTTPKISDNESKYEDFTITEDENPEKISGINNVDIDREMSELAANNIRFKFAAKRTNAFYKNLQNVIKGNGAA